MIAGTIVATKERIAPEWRHRIRLSTTAYTSDNFHLAIPTHGKKLLYIFISLYVHNARSILNLVAIATVFKVNRRKSTA